MRKINHFFQGTITAEERENLYNEIWSEPVKTVAQRYEISDVALRKHCVKYGIPLPPRGYWEKLKAGKSVYKPALPKVVGDLKNHIRNYVIRYKHDVKNLSDDELKTGQGMFLLTMIRKNILKKSVQRLKLNLSCEILIF
ncbi:hypothetical protein [Paenibacillus elgii]|uniref:hypothetical protein n=1 Tax=Paenibacillus elgii TaxID=189691 RepID=UPI0013D25D53|nr:hypothetical protein [Paenibacillus elgii]